MDLKKYIEQLKYSIYVIFHPIDGFYEVKIRNKGSWKIASIFYIIYAIVSVIDYQYTGYLVNYNYISEMNSIYIIVINILPLFLFVIGNWSITTLFEGKGRFNEIYTVIGYSLIPQIVFSIIAIILSNIMVPDELTFYTVIIITGYAFFFITAFVGLLVIHEYSVSKNIITVIVSFFSMLVIIFFIILFSMLSQQIYEFIKVFLKELFLRLGDKNETMY